MHYELCIIFLGHVKVYQNPAPVNAVARCRCLQICLPPSSQLQIYFAPPPPLRRNDRPRKARPPARAPGQDLGRGAREGHHPHQGKTTGHPQVPASPGNRHRTRGPPANGRDPSSTAPIPVHYEKAEKKIDFFQIIVNFCLPNASQKRLFPLIPNLLSNLELSQY